MFSIQNSKIKKLAIISPALFIPSAFLLPFLVKARHIAMTGLIADLRDDSPRTFERIGFLAAVVHRDNLFCPTC